MIQKPDRDWLAFGHIVGVDFDEKVIEFRYQGDLKPLVKGRYVLVPADAFHLMVLRLEAAKAKVPSDG